MSFLETPVFPGCPSYGYVARPQYSTTIVRMANGREYRNRNWSRPLYRYEVTIGPRRQDEIQKLLEFFHAVGGEEEGFRFKDWADFKSCRVGDTPSRTDQPLVLTEGSPAIFYQLTKRYTAGARTQDREIYKPVSGTILIADNGTLKTEATHYTIDYTTGIVELLFSPVGTLTWGGEFDVPVRFEGDFPLEITNFEIQSVALSLVEFRL